MACLQLLAGGLAKQTVRREVITRHWGVDDEVADEEVFQEPPTSRKHTAKASKVAGRYKQ